MPVKLKQFLRRFVAKSKLILRHFSNKTREISQLVSKMIKATFFVFLSLALKAIGSPFLSADPWIPQSDPNLNPVSFIIKGIQTNPISSQVYVQPSNGNLWLMYDLATLPNGTYTVIVDAVNIFGGVSPDSSPFTFTKGVPGTPSNLRIMQDRPL